MHVKMNLSPSQSRRTQRSFLPNELITEVLSRLPVKSFMRMRCLSKSSNSLFTNPNFVKLHLDRSARNRHLALVTSNTESVVPYPVCNLLDNTPITLDDDPCYLTHENLHPFKDKVIREVVGSCNGLICLLSYSPVYQDFWLRLWNPSTRIISKKLGHRFRLFNDRLYEVGSIKFTFGYDNSSDTYKVVALKFNGDNVRIVDAKILSFGDDVWRKIEIFPALPFQLLNYHNQVNVGVYLSGTFNWLAVFEFNALDVEQYVIISLDLGTETYTQMQLPSSFNKMPRCYPVIGMLMSYLCFSYDFNETHFVIWRMMEFGVKESWTQFLKISYQHLQSDFDYGYDRKFYLAPLVPLYLSDDGDTLILTSYLDDQAIIFNRRDNSVELTTITNEIYWFSVKEYVESLVSIC